MYLHSKMSINCTGNEISSNFQKLLIKKLCCDVLESTMLMWVKRGKSSPLLLLNNFKFDDWFRVSDETSVDICNKKDFFFNCAQKLIDKIFSQLHQISENKSRPSDYISMNFINIIELKFYLTYKLWHTSFQINWQFTFDMTQLDTYFERSWSIFIARHFYQILIDPTING